jgi:hypothetical protein
MTNDYALTHKLKQLSNKGAGSVSSLNSDVQKMYPSYNHFNKPKSRSSEKIEINNGELPKSILSCSYCAKRGHIVSESWVLKRKIKNKLQSPFACNVLKDIIIPIEVEESNLRVSKAQSNILEALYN